MSTTKQIITITITINEISSISITSIFISISFTKKAKSLLLIKMFIIKASFCLSNEFEILLSSKERLLFETISMSFLKNRLLFDTQSSFLILSE